MNIGVYGGSFNPPHNGHLFLATELQKKLSLDKIIIIPSNISPQKSDNGHIDPIHRLNMCRLVFSESVFDVSDCEISRGGKSYTFDTLNYILSQYPNAKIFLFMGSDMLLSFCTWFRYKDILKMCTVCAISRGEGDNTDKMRQYAKENLIDGNVRIFDLPEIEVSSSLIREKIGKNEDINNLVPQKAAEYIKENGLYGQADL